MYLPTITNCDNCGKELRGNQKNYETFQTKTRLYIYTLCDECNNEEVKRELRNGKND